MFDLGFIADLRFILRRLPPPERRQSFLFSATLSFRVLELTWEFMNNPSQDTVRPQQQTAERVEQTLYHVGREEKFPLLLGLMRREGDRFLIFSNTREEARRLEDRLVRNGWDARALTGDVDQKRRLRIINDFKEGTLPVLVATDVASRGLHIEAVSHVINWDLPQDAEDYVHRIGRTARAGAAGRAIGLVDEASVLNLEAIEKFIGQKIPVEWAEDDLLVAEIKPSADERRRFAEERRARLDARRGLDRGGRRGGGAGRPAPHAHHHPPAGAAAPADAQRRPRRRRRSGGGPRPGGGPRGGGVVVTDTEGSAVDACGNTVAPMMAMVRRVPQEDRATREGHWQTPPIGVDMHGKTLGVIGLGRIGGKMAAFGRLLGMRVLATGLTLTDERAAAAGATRVDLDTLLRESDVVSVHYRLSDNTRGLIPARHLALNKPGE